MSKEKKSTARKYNNPSPYSPKPRFDQIKLPAGASKSLSYKADPGNDHEQSLINPLGVITLVKSVCKTCHMYCSPVWRDSEDVADRDAAKHIDLGHWTGYTYKYVTRNG